MRCLLLAGCFATLLMGTGCGGSVDHPNQGSAAGAGSGGGSGSTSTVTGGTLCPGLAPVCTACDSDVQPDATCKGSEWVCPPGYSAGPVDCRPPPACCGSAADCSPEQTCVEFDCKPLIDGACWTDAECGPGMHCEGASPCPCDVECDQDEPGACVGVDGGM